MRSSRRRWRSPLRPSTEKPDRPRVACCGRGRQRPHRKLDDESRGAREAVVLPVRRRPVRPADAPVAHARGPGVPPRRGAALTPGAYERLWLVEPERHVGPNAEDEAPDEPRLALRPGTRARVLRVPPPADRAPLDRKSTRLNSSHANISYAVFCLKKK